jgi:hypothetical protein
MTGSTLVITPDGTGARNILQAAASQPVAVLYTNWYM